MTHAASDSAADPPLKFAPDSAQESTSRFGRFWARNRALFLTLHSLWALALQAGLSGCINPLGSSSDPVGEPLLLRIQGNVTSGTDGAPLPGARIVRHLELLGVPDLLDLEPSGDQLIMPPGRRLEMIVNRQSHRVVGR